LQNARWAAGCARQRRLRRRRFACGELPNARHVENLHRLIYYGIVKNSKLQVFHRLISHGIVKNPPLSLKN
jgi:hypothetical protein